MDYEDFELQIGPRQGDGYALRVLRSPEGQAEGFFRLPALDDDSGDREPGARLYQAVFQDAIAACFHQSLSRVGGDGSRGLRLRLRINPGDRQLAALQEIPWERLYREETQDFLALSRHTAIVRTLDLPRAVRGRSLEPPLRVVVVLAQGLRREPLDLETEVRALEALAEKTPNLELEILRDPDLATLRSTLDRSRAHVLHYLGHGHFNARTGAGALLLAGEPGGTRKLDGRTLATKIKDLGSLRLVVLNACDTARAGTAREHDPFAGVATALVLGGIPAVVAMQQPVADRRAMAFSVPFYAALAESRSLEEAMTEGRQGMLDLASRDADWSNPVLFLSSPSGEMLPPRAAEPEASVAPGTTAERRSWIRSFGGPSAWILGLLLLVGGLVDSPLRTALAGIVPWGAGELTQSVDTSPGDPESQELAKSPSPSIEEITLGSGASVLELASPKEFDPVTKAVFIDALRQAMTSGAEMSGRRVRVDLGPPQVQSTRGTGFSGWSCRLTATCRVLGDDEPHSTLEAAQARRVRALQAEACELAAQALAQDVARKLAQHDEETS